MRLIFSRKGFDSQYGGVPSPILPDGTLLSLPIPSSGDSCRLGSLKIDGINVGKLSSDLTNNRINSNTTVHLDPDLRSSSLERISGWRPTFGQIAAAQSHLMKQGVGVGDVFLFFGWFREVECINGIWRYIPGSPNMHVLFGWLQIGEVLPVSGCVHDAISRHPWLSEHPHIWAANRFTRSNNTIYIASDSIRIGDWKMGSSGGGIFERFTPTLRLTAIGCKRSCWRLPEWFAPSDNRLGLTYHGNPSRWIRRENSVLLQTVAKGQEFVLDCGYYPKSTEWLMTLFTECL